MKDSNNISSIVIDPTNSLDSGNNTNWFPPDPTTGPGADAPGIDQGGAGGPSEEKRAEIAERYDREQAKERRKEELEAKATEVTATIEGLRGSASIDLTLGERECIYGDAVVKPIGLDNVSRRNVPDDLAFMRLTDEVGGTLLPLSGNMWRNPNQLITRVQALELVLRSSCLEILGGEEIREGLGQGGNEGKAGKGGLHATRTAERKLSKAATVWEETESPFSDIPLDFTASISIGREGLPGTSVISLENAVWERRVILSSYLYGIFSPLPNTNERYILADPTASVSAKDMHNFLMKAITVRNALSGTEPPLESSLIVDASFPIPSDEITPVPANPKKVIAWGITYFVLPRHNAARSESILPLTVSDVLSGLFTYVTEGGFVAEGTYSHAEVKRR